jgi:hypothetical protein
LPTTLTIKNKEKIKKSILIATGEKTRGKKGNWWEK